MLIDRLHYALGLDVSGLRSGTTQAHGLLGMLNGKMASLAKGAGILAIGTALAGIGIKATKMASELDAAMGEIWSITDKTAKQMEAITADILDLSKRVPESAVGLAKAYYQILSAGITDTSDALNVLEVSSKGATAGLTTTFTVVDAITNILNAYNLEASESARISDELFIAVRDGKVTMEQLAGSIGGVVGTAALAKVELKDVLAAIVSMTLSGYSVDESVTSINRLLLSIVDTQDEAKEAAKSLGIEWSVAGMQARGFQNFIRDLNEKAGDNIEVLQKIVPEIRAFRAAAVVAGTGADAFKSSLDHLKNSAGATEEALNKIMDDIQQQWSLEKNRLNAAFIELGQKILPVVKDGLQIINDLFEKVGLSGTTAAERLQKEWQGLATTITTVTDITSRMDVLQKALTLILTPGSDVEKNFEQVREMFQAYPALSAEAKEVQGYLEMSSADLIEALHAEIDYLKKAATEAKNLGLEEKQRLITAQEMQKYQQQVVAAQRQAKALGMEKEYERLGEILNRLKNTEKEWSVEKRLSLMDMKRSASEQILLTKLFETAGNDVKNMQTEVLANTNKLMVSEQRLKEIEEIRVAIANQAKVAREAEQEKLLAMLKTMKEMERVKPGEFYQRMSQSTIQTTDRGGGLPYGAMPVPEPTEIKLFNNEMEKLWATFIYGEDATRNLTSASMKLVDALFEGDQATHQFATGIIEVASGLATSNPLTIFEGIVDVFSGLFGSSKRAGEATKSLTERMKEYTEQLQEMTYAQLQQQMKELADWYNSLKNPAERIGYAEIFQAKMQTLNEQLKNFGKWGDDFASMIERWNYEVRLLNIDDPTEKMKLLVKYAKQYLGIQLPESIEQGFMDVKEFLEALGTGKNIKEAWLAAFGSPFPTSVTDEQIRDLIQTYQEAIKEMQDAAVDASGQSGATKTEEESVAFSKTKQITYRQAEEMTLALWSMDDYLRSIYNVLDTRLGMSAIQTIPATIEIKPEINWVDVISRLNIYATSVMVSSQNCIVDVSKANVYLSGTSFSPETYSKLIVDESTRSLRGQGLAWVS